MGFKVYGDGSRGVVAPIFSGDIFAITLQSEVVAGTLEATRVSIGMAANIVCQCFTYVRVVGTTEWILKHSQESFVYGIADPTYGHIQLVTGLAGSTNYETYQHIIDLQGNALDTTVFTFTTATAAVATGTNIPDAGYNAQFLAEGYAIYWQDTPSVDDVGMTLTEYKATDHWSNGHASSIQGEDRSTVPNEIALCPLDNTPAWRNIRLPDADNNGDGFWFHGRQMSDQGVAGVESYIISDRFYTPSVASGGIVRNPDKLGMYAGFGHIVMSLPGYTGGTSGGSNWTEDTVTIRLKLQDNNGGFGLYLYDEQRRQYWLDRVAAGTSSRMGQGATFTALTPQWESIRGGWIDRAIRITPKLPITTANDEIEIIINGVSRLTFTTQLFKSADMRLKGHGVFFQNYGSRTAGPETAYVKDHKIYVKYI